MITEAAVTKQIIDFLKAKKRAGVPVWWAKIAGGPRQRAGLPDLRVIACGRSADFEIKRPGGAPTQLQRATIEAIREAGGYAEVVYSLQEFRHCFATLLGEQNQ